MPYRSLAQERWAHTDAGKKALGGENKVKEWDSASKGMSLPERVQKKKKKPSGSSYVTAVRMA